MAGGADSGELGAIARSLEIGVIGASAVGKSTLVNALLSERLALLPQGGVGPFTASPIRVCHAQEPYFWARYVSREALIQLLRRLDGRRAQDELHERELRWVQLMVRGTQFGVPDERYLVGCLRAVLDGSMTQVAPVDRERVVRIRDCALGSRDRQAGVIAGLDLPAFLEQLRLHAGGHMAPLTEEIEVGWECPLLRAGVSLVDLPGLGVAQDSYRSHTSAWLEHGRAVLLVVDRAGVPEAVLTLLEHAGFLDRLVAREPVAAAIAVTQIDGPASDARRAERLARGGAARSFDEHFHDQCAASIAMVRNQLRAAVSGAAAERVACLLERVSIHPVSAPAYQGLHRDDPEEPAGLTSPEVSGIPSLIRRLRALGNTENDMRRAS